MAQKTILILEDDAFSPTTRGRSVSTLKTKHMPAFQAAEVVIYLLPGGGIRMLKNSRQEYKTEYRAG